MPDEIDEVEETTTGYLPGASWPQVLAIGVIVAALAFAVGWKIQEGGTPGEDSVDVGFLRDMIDHHDQANLMSLLVLRPQVDVDPQVGAYAKEILLEQRFQIGLMTAWLDDWGVGRGDPDRQAMEWMVGGHGTPVDEMFGMQSPEKIEELEAATGEEASRLYLEMMIDHHRGGIHMAEDAARNADEEKVRALAERVAKYQAGETTDLRNLQERLGFPVT